MESAIESNALLKAIRDAWADDMPPPPDRVATCPCGGCEGTRVTLGGKPWQEIDDDRAEAVIGELPLLTKEAVRHYLPMWLSRATEDPHSEFSLFLLFALRDPDHDWYSAVGFSDAQFAVIREWLRLRLRNWDDDRDEFDLPYIDCALIYWFGEPANE